MPPGKTKTVQARQELTPMRREYIARADYNFRTSFCPRCGCNSVIMHSVELSIPRRILSTAEVTRYFTYGVGADDNKICLPDEVHCTECRTITEFTDEE
jgi:hypothetical protein